MVAAVDIFTKSRSGQLAFVAVLGVYLLRRLGWLGLVLAALAGVPMLLLGGRSGAEADESSDLRLGYWAAAIQMARDIPAAGGGHGPVHRAPAADRPQLDDAGPGRDRACPGCCSGRR